MNLLEQLKLLGELSTAIRTLKEEKDALKRLRLTQQIQKLRIALGLIKESKDENEIDPNNLTELVLPEKATKAEKRKVVEQWLKDNLQAKNNSTQLKFIKTLDGKKIFFNRRKSIDHFTSDSGRYEELGFKSVTKIPEVFATGQFIGIEPLHKIRTDDFVAFHVYRKKVKIDSYTVELQVKAGQRSDEILEIAGMLIGYSFKIKTLSENVTSLPVPSATDTNSGNALTSLQDSSLSPSSSKIGTPLGELTTGKNHTLSLDNIQEENDFLVQILRVWDKFGNVLL